MLIARNPDMHAGHLEKLSLASSLEMRWTLMLTLAVPDLIGVFWNTLAKFVRLHHF